MQSFSAPIEEKTCSTDGGHSYLAPCASAICVRARNRVRVVAKAWGLCHHRAEVDLTPNQTNETNEKHRNICRVAVAKVAALSRGDGVLAFSRRKWRTEDDIACLLPANCGQMRYPALPHPPVILVVVLLIIYYSVYI